METIKLDLIPGKKMPSLHASQYDDGRDYHIDLTENRAPYTLDGTETISLTVRKCDNTLVTMDIANTFAGKSYIEFRTTEQMNACAGFNYGEITIEKNGTQISSLNFYLQVEGAPDEDGIQSQSEINNLARQVHDAVVEELEDNGASETGYDNTESGLEATNVQDAIDEVNTKIENIPSVDAYTKEESDQKYATKTALEEVAGAVDDKANKTNPELAGTFSLNRLAGSAIGTRSFAEGFDTTASGSTTHAEGYKTKATTSYAHAEGYQSEATGNTSHAEGLNTKATGTNAHTEGNGTIASGTRTHAEGQETKASGDCAHTEGAYTEATGDYSHAEGFRNRANHRSQRVFGEFNAYDDSVAPATARGNYIEIVGNGTATNARSNARTLDWNGNETLAGDLKINGNVSMSDVKAEVDRLSDITKPIDEVVGYDSPNMKMGYYINNGVETPTSAALSCCDYVPVSVGDKFLLLYCRSIAKFGTDKSYIGDIGVASLPLYSGNEKWNMYVADFEGYIRVTFYNDKTTKYAITKLTDTPYECVCLGDSIFGNRQKPYDCPTYIQNVTNLKTANCGFGGTRASTHSNSVYTPLSFWSIADAIASGDWSAIDIDWNSQTGDHVYKVNKDILINVDWSKVKVICVHYGTNDWNQNCLIDNQNDKYDKTTYKGALRYGIETILTAYQNITIVLSSPLFRYWSNSQDYSTVDSDSDSVTRTGGKLTDFVQAMREVAEEYHLPFIDNYNELGMNKFNAPAFLSDGTHPSFFNGIIKIGTEMGGNVFKTFLKARFGE